MDNEAEPLLHFLNQQRNHVLGILEGMTDEQLRRPVLPSGWKTRQLSPALGKCA